MDSIEFLMIIASFTTVLSWYWINVEKGGNGEYGLFALVLSEAELAEKRPSYRVKVRKASALRPRPMERDAQRSSNEVITASYKKRSDAIRSRRRFRRQDEVRYKIKDKAASYRQTNAAPALAQG